MRSSAIQRCKGMPPLHVPIRNAKLLVQPAKLGMLLFVLVLLPLRAGGVAEEDSAAERADGMYRAETFDLESAAAGLVVGCWLWAVGR